MVFQRLRRILAIVLDCIFLFPFVFWTSVVAYNESVHWVSTNVDALEFVLFVNEYSLGLYFILIFPLFYILYELIGYFLMRRTLGQYFMQISLRSFDTTTMIFRVFFSVSLHLVTLGIFSLVNASLGLVTGQTIIDRLSRSQPVFEDENIQQASLKLLTLLGGVTIAGSLSLYVHSVVSNECFEITCIKEVVLKDTIEQKILEQKLVATTPNQQTVQLNQWDYQQLQENFFLPDELANVPSKNYNYDFFEITFTESLQVYSPNYSEWVAIASGEPWQLLLTKSKTGLQPWELYLRDFNRDQFVPIRAVVTSLNQNSYQWVINVSPDSQVNTQWNIKLSHELGTTTQVTIEK